MDQEDTPYEDTLEVFFEVQVTRVVNTLRRDTKSEEINRKLQREALMGIEPGEVRSVAETVQL